MAFKVSTREEEIVSGNREIGFPTILRKKMAVENAMEDMLRDKRMVEDLIEQFKFAIRSTPYIDRLIDLDCLATRKLRFSHNNERKAHNTQW